MTDYRLTELENALIMRNPELSRKLQPGLSENRIRKLLERAKVKGAIEPLIHLYGWRNGVVLNKSIAHLNRGFFPGKMFFPTDLDYALAQFEFFKEASVAKPKLAEAKDRYFPVLWDEGVQWLAIDLEPLYRNRVMLVDTRGEPHFREAYASFEEFVDDLIRANREDMALRCFEQP